MKRTTLAMFMATALLCPATGWAQSAKDDCLAADGRWIARYEAGTLKPNGTDTYKVSGGGYCRHYAKPAPVPAPTLPPAAVEPIREPATDTEVEQGEPKVYILRFTEPS